MQIRLGELRKIIREALEDHPKYKLGNRKGGLKSIDWITEKDVFTELLEPNAWNSNPKVRVQAPFKVKKTWRGDEALAKLSQEWSSKGYKAFTPIDAMDVLQHDFEIPKIASTVKKGLSTAESGVWLRMTRETRNDILERLALALGDMFEDKGMTAVTEMGSTSSASRFLAANVSHLLGIPHHAGIIEKISHPDELKIDWSPLEKVPADERENVRQQVLDKQKTLRDKLATRPKKGEPTPKLTSSDIPYEWMRKYFPNTYKLGRQPEMGHRYLVIDDNVQRGYSSKQAARLMGNDVAFFGAGYRWPVS